MVGDVGAPAGGAASSDPPRGEDFFDEDGVAGGVGDAGAASSDPDSGDSAAAEYGALPTREIALTIPAAPISDAADRMCRATSRRPAARGDCARLFIRLGSPAIPRPWVAFIIGR
ncbi:MAG TPA: hypothetical protein VND95_07505 [Stellaceae bacterium]|nr:hypothetical protein [Stellaceae bacterium]